MVSVDPFRPPDSSANTVNNEFGLKKVRRFPPELEGAAEHAETHT
jgi:hypothetical protein